MIPLPRHHHGPIAFKNYLHLVFSTKGRRPWLADKAIRDELHAYLTGSCRNLESPSIQIGGVEDHVHLLCILSKNISVSQLCREIKRESSKWFKTKHANLDKFAWQGGYGAFSVSPSHVEALVHYIATQEEHHQRETFQQEFRRLLKKYGIQYDEKFVWE